MRRIYPRCAGMDVHKRTVVVCRRCTPPDGPEEVETRTFGTTTGALLELLDWLESWGCTHAAMESTGNYWKPVYNILEGHVELLLVNAHHVKNVPGRKTDVRDAEWLADLLAHGLLRASYVPAQPQRELRELTRGRSVLVADRARLLNRLQQSLESANLKLGTVASDLQGVSARAMLTALAAGEADPVVLADLAKGKLRRKRAELEAALNGRVGPHHRFLLAQFLEQWDFLDDAVSAFDHQIQRHLDALEPEPPSEAPQAPGGPPPATPADRAPDPTSSAAPVRQPPSTPPSFAAAVRLLDPIPGIGERGAQNILAEIGVDMDRHGTEGRISRWSGLAPGNHQSGGKRLSGKITPGNPALRKALIQAAHGAIHTKDSFFQALYRRLAARRGKKRAIVAVAHRLLIVIFHVLLYQEPYRELGADHLDESRKEATVERLVKRLTNLGYQAHLEPLAA